MAKDLFHQNVRDALEKEGWTITHDPYILKHRGLRMEVDLGAEKMIAAERDSEKILVEVKGFLSKSILYDFHEALGQYRNYRRVLRKQENSRTLILAVPEDAWNSFFAEPFGQEAIEEEGLLLLVFSPVTNTVLQWIK
ncbi:MAG: element excision factor XisH family protein [Saprospiraceae bacterium]